MSFAIFLAIMFYLYPITIVVALAVIVGLAAAIVLTLEDDYASNHNPSR